ncbi:MAG: type IV pilus assembly protein PilM [Candidatus Taylorbacteria bacterium]|nr:type IV pilus assembly protein PilM [Candidatus Taylorbacteria bacterium]
MRNTFSDFFPVPKLLRMQPVGLSLTEWGIHVVELVKRGEGLTLGRFGARAIPTGAIQEGYVHDKQAVIDALRPLQQELGIEFVSVALPEEKAYLFKTEVPIIAKDTIREALELRLEENVPIPSTEAVFDFMVIPHMHEADHVDVSVSAFPSKVVLTYLEIVTAAGLIPVSFGIEAAALARALIPDGNRGTFMIVSIGETRTSISIASRGVVQFSTTVPIGGDALTKALEKHFSVDTKEAKKIKEEKGFVKNRENMQLFFSLMNTVSSIKDEINKLITFWNTHRNPPGSVGKTIEKIILCGRDSSLAGFDEYLGTTIKIPVETGSVWQNAFMAGEQIPAISHLDSLDYASAIGLALPEAMHHV